MGMRRHWIALALTALPAAASAADTTACSARSGPTAATVVELYTSEGCSSCPPADRWLSRLKPGAGETLALALHVNYWDYLGWPDRFASPEHTERQRRLQAVSGAANVYTPQVIVNGRDWRGWPGATPVPATGAAPVLTLERSGAQQYTVIVPALPTRAAGYWAVLEDGHRSAVRAGENAGATLLHDHVVRLYRSLSAWPAGAPTRWQLTLTSPADPATPRRIAFVLTDEHHQRPFQAVVLAGC